MTGGQGLKGTVGDRLEALATHVEKRDTSLGTVLRNRKLRLRRGIKRVTTAERKTISQETVRTPNKKANNVRTKAASIAERNLTSPETVRKKRLSLAKALVIRADRKDTSQEIVRTNRQAPGDASSRLAAAGALIMIEITEPARRRSSTTGCGMKRRRRSLVKTRRSLLRRSRRSWRRRRRKSRSRWIKWHRQGG